MAIQEAKRDTNIRRTPSNGRESQLLNAAGMIVNPGTIVFDLSYVCMHSANFIDMLLVGTLIMADSGSPDQNGWNERLFGKPFDRWGMSNATERPSRTYQVVIEQLNSLRPTGPPAIFSLGVGPSTPKSATPTTTTTTFQDAVAP
ncbi:hypothetical protein FRB96_002206 [Tulasnella sp. 330]|nr:hypothetical protein FRB96_002206 [Tulasnella sp. 330]KAG8875370.1 hypothetical protein FRB97_005182 [Tulasnella sp. 331]KAG8887311.1 hypothetical protein FRB98_000239 [Tulasnella sp. 332]